MKVCTFFGHRQCPDNIKPRLKAVLTDLILRQGVDVFYVGNQGQFDAYVRATLKQLIMEFPQIRFAVVLAYMPGRKNEDEDYSDTMLPEGVENVHPRYAIAWRNNWMLKQAEYVVTYITHSWGGAAQYGQKAKKAGKTVINLE